MSDAAAGSSPVTYLPTVLAAALVLLSFVATPRPAATGPVATALQSASSADRATVAAVYGALADIMARDSGKVITTTTTWRAIYSDALRLAVGGTGLVGKYPGLDRAVEEVFAKHYDLTATAIDKVLADKIVAACKDVEAQSE